MIIVRSRSGKIKVMLSISYNSYIILLLCNTHDGSGKDDKSDGSGKSDG